MRRLLKTAQEQFGDLKITGAQDAATFNTDYIVPVIDAIDEMIFKEEKILFPTALSVLKDEDWYEIYKQSDEYGYAIYDPQFVWQPDGVRVEEVAGTAQGGVIQMRTGNFKLPELVALFQTLPVDITFIDSEDTVRYFSPGRHRIFDRSRAILGRKVQNCHPPKSVNLVNKIIADFKNGKQDSARFWINMRGRMIYIVYFALRDDERNYLGTIEVTEDITEIKSLEGERRLLAYDE